MPRTRERSDPELAEARAVPPKRKVKRAYFVGGGSFPYDGGTFHVPPGRHSVDEVLKDFKKEDRTNIVLHALKTCSDGDPVRVETAYDEIEDEG